MNSYYPLLIVYWGSYLVFPFVGGLLYLWCKTSKKLSKRSYLVSKIFLLLWIVVSGVFCWARFIEPNMLVTHTTTIDAWFWYKIALISDMHMWVFNNERLMDRVVKKVNQSDIDAVFIAGDLTYEPHKKDFWRLFARVWELKKPVFVVLWNHDVERPWPNIRKKLTDTLVSFGAQTIDNKIVMLEWTNQEEIILVWLGSFLWKESNVSLLEQYKQSDNVVVLTHNPDTTLLYTSPIADITLAWHTHWWQIRIPWLYKYAIPTIWNFDRNLTQEPLTQLFVTAWLGTVWLPMRLFNPPVIDILTLK